MPSKNDDAPDQKAARSRSQVIERDRKAFELRRRGKNFDEIATELGFANKGSAYKAHARAMARGQVDSTSIEEARQLELARLDAMQAGLWKAASRGDLGAVDKSLKIMMRRDRLLGLAVAARSPGRGTNESGTGTGSGAGVVVGRDRLDEMREKRERDAAHRSSST